MTLPHCTRSRIAAVALVCNAVLTGCGPSFFSTRGTVSSTGTRFGTWSAAPVGCTRDSFLGSTEGLPARSVVTLLWQDPSANYIRPDLYLMDGPDGPIRLEIAATGSTAAPVLSANLHTMRVPGGTRIDTSACRTFTLQQSERPSPEPRAHPSLNGLLQMDCTLPDAHFTAHLRFTGCVF